MKKNTLTFIITLVLLVIAAWFISKNHSGTIKEELKNFAVRDTGSITKIFLADKYGGSASVVKEKPGKWMVNGKYEARHDAIITLLSTMKNIEVRSPVGKAAYNSVIKQIAAGGIKVEIYQNNELTKTYYVGGATQDQLGTFMYLENSAVPFVIHIPGFDGYLTPRYITSENEWRLHNVFNTQMEDISSVISEDLENPQNSFMIAKQANGDFLFTTYPSRTPVPDVEQNKVQNYLSEFSFVNYERESTDKKETLDSVKRVGAFHALTLTDKSNKTRKISLFRMPPSNVNQIFEDSTRTYDKDRMYALMDNEVKFITVQYYTFSKLLRTPDDFRLKPAAVAKHPAKK